MPMPTGSFTAPIPSRDQNGMYYSDMVVPSMPPSSAPLPLQQQPMSWKASGTLILSATTFSSVLLRQHRVPSNSGPCIDKNK